MHDNNLPFLFLLYPFYLVVISCKICLSIPPSEQEKIIKDQKDEINFITKHYQNSVEGFTEDDLKRTLLDSEKANETIKNATLNISNLNKFYDKNEKIILKNAENAKRTQEEIDKAMNGIDDIMGNLGNLGGGGGSIPNVDKVGEVGKVNSKVDISSEDLRYMKELAEKEAINQFTQKMLAPQIYVTFGDVRETADVKQIETVIANALKEKNDVSMEGY